MKSIILLMLICIRPALSQVTDYFIPAGFSNPFLKSGQFIANINYGRFESVTSIQNQTETDSYLHTISVTGLIGLTDRITFRADVSVYPGQTVLKIVEGGAGKDREQFNIAPSLTLSYRPYENLEIFGNFDYRTYTRVLGEKGRYLDVPIGVDNEGNIIYEQVLSVIPQSDIQLESRSIKIGVSYFGSLW